MQELLDKLNNLRNSEIKTLIDARLAEFSTIRNGTMDSIFKELCFCITTANCSAERCIEVQEKIGNGFLTLSETELPLKLKELKYRFPNIRSSYIIEARKKLSQLEDIIKSADDDISLREWMVKNVKGIGYKEASHFLRNIGYIDYAIVDFHIMDLLVKHELVEKPKTMTKSKYLDIENILRNIGNKLNLNMAELDLYLWFLETGKILK